MGKQRLELTERDIMILHVLNRWRVAQQKQLQCFLGWRSGEYLKKRLQRLTHENYVKHSRKHIRESYVYELGEKGKEVLGITNAATVSDGTLDHELGVLTCACFFREYFADANLDYHSMITDRDFRQYEYSKDNFFNIQRAKMERKGDLVFQVDGKWWIIEYEKEKKAYRRVQENIAANKTAAYGQIWVYPKLRTGIARNLREAADYIALREDQFQLFTFEEIEKVLKRPPGRLAQPSDKPIEEWIEEYNNNEANLFRSIY